MHWHTFFELAYVLEGTCTNYSGNQRLELKKGDLLILAPGTSHGIGAFTDSCRIINVMIRTATFEETFFNKFYEDDVLFSFFKNVLYHYKKNTYILFHTGEDALLLCLLEEIQPHHSYQEQIRISSLSLIFSRIMDKHAATAIVFGDDAEDAV
jgi:hypothetical protein